MLNEFLLLAIAHMFAVASPGADFAVVIKNSLRSGKTVGVATALGIGLGILVHMIYTLFGVAVILAQSEWLFSLVKYLGAGYLLWLAFKSFQSRKKTDVEKEALLKQASQTNDNLISAIKQGFVVNVLNPKVTLFFVALFANIVSPETPLIIQSADGLWLAVYTFMWFSLVAWGFSRQVVLSWYQSHGHIIDWFMGGMLLLIAAKLVFL
jgi:RhtB (resistance to homoserine/threonine) family protein